MRYAMKVFGPNGRIKNGAEILTGDEVRQLEPSMGPKVVGATYHKRGATVDPYPTFPSSEITDFLCAAKYLWFHTFVNVISHLSCQEWASGRI